MAWRITERCNARNYTDIAEKASYRYAYNVAFSHGALDFDTDEIAKLYPNACGAGFNDGMADKGEAE